MALRVTLRMVLQFLFFILMRALAAAICLVLVLVVGYGFVRMIEYEQKGEKWVELEY